MRRWAVCTAGSALQAALCKGVAVDQAQIAGRTPGLTSTSGERFIMA